MPDVLDERPYTDAEWELIIEALRMATDHGRLRWSVLTERERLTQGAAFAARVCGHSLYRVGWDSDVRPTRIRLDILASRIGQLTQQLECGTVVLPDGNVDPLLEPLTALRETARCSASAAAPIVEAAERASALRNLTAYSDGR